MAKKVKRAKKKLTKKFFQGIGREGGRSTLKNKGPKHFSKISKRRKKFAGGRPEKKK